MYLKLSTVTMMIKHWHWQKLLWSLGTTLTIAATGAPRSVMAAESIYLKAGPFQTKVNVEDLEEFSRTGKIPSSLGFYSFVLTPSVRTLLNQNVDLDQPLVKEFIVSFLGTTEAQDLLDQLAGMFPQMSGEELAIALKLTITKADELNLISLIRAYPNPSITLDLAAGVTMLLQFNATQLQSQLLVPTLEAEFAQSTEQTWDHTMDLTAPGNEIITTETLFLEDQKRDRTITVDLYHSSQGNKPLVVMSHGFASDRRFLKYLAMHLASHGYAVVSIEHKGSTIDEYLTAEGVTINPGEIIDPQEFINRPQDVSFVMDELTRLQQKIAP
ncbi:MAG: alpha/beta hydrolase [Synechococcaceae cyanobacterium RL_1_2]|nr:alpha/beta hydrolase [Synechococcaceae cyanobacterium RL_1_2]